MTKREYERRERFWVYDDFTPEQRAEIRRLYFERRCDPVDIADEFDTDIGTVFKIVTGE